MLGKKKKLVISAPIGAVANDINRNMVYTTLKVNNQARKNYHIKINLQLLYHFLLIIDKVSMIGLNFLTSINK